MNAIICRYAEIGIKGKNRGDFEQRLADNLLWLMAVPGLTARRVRGRVLVQRADRSAFSPEEIALFKRQLPKAFGLQSWSFGVTVPKEMERISAAVETMVPGVIAEKRQELGRESLSFRVRARRPDKTFPIRSKTIELALSEMVLSRFQPLTVDLIDAEVSVYCEIARREAYVFFDSKNGPGGLPVGSNPPTLALLSGGIDSPVACHQIMRRGSPVDFLTFHSHPYTPMESLDKVRSLAAILNAFQGPRRLFACNFAEVQKVIRDTCQDKFRALLYRRIMLRLAETIAAWNGNKALVTGECLGQVASQTLINMGNIDQAVDALVLRPLVGLDKLDIIRIAEQIGTFGISKVQLPDSCTVFAPNAPSTAAPRGVLLWDEKKLDMAKILRMAITTTSLLDIASGDGVPIAEIFPEAKAFLAGGG